MNQPHWKDDDMGELVRFPDQPNEPVVGELVDADHDGLPDTSHATRPGELAERPDAEVVDVGPVLNGVVIERHAEPTLAWRRVIDTRPVLPTWMSEREQRIEAIKWATRYTWHRIKFHAVRALPYALKLAARSPRGLVRCVVWWGRWAFDQEAQPLRKTLVESGDGSNGVIYHRLAVERDKHIKHRLIGSGIGALVLAAGLVTMDFLYPTGWWLVLPGAVAGLGAIGGQPGRPLVKSATVTHAASKLTPTVVLRAFIAAGLATEKNPITFPQDVARDGKGWLAVLDLPYGKTFQKHAANKVADIASGLDVNQVMVFLDPDSSSERRVRLWVSDVDVFAQKPVLSPLLKKEKWDLWQGVPFGVDARDSLVTMPLVWSNLLVGAIPRMGKTFSARIPAAAGALDPHVRLYVFNGKGDRSWGPFEKVAHAYGSGQRDEVVELLVASLTGLVADMNDRYERMSKLPADQCPEAKLTPALAQSKRLNMPLTMVAIDEIQRYLEHKDHGETILELLTDLVKVGPAAGIILVLATQKPDSKVMPDSLRGQIGTRFAMRVMTWQASETILGAGTYTAGMDASKFQQKHKGVGILLGGDDGELSERGGQTVRSHLLADEGLELLCDRGRALRQEIGTLTGMAAGDGPAGAIPARALENLADVFQPGEDKAHTEVLLARLAVKDPEVYDGWSPQQLAAALKPHGVKSKQAWAIGVDGASANRQGYTRESVIAALTARIDRQDNPGLER